MMKNITLSAQDTSIDGLRQIAQVKHTTVNDMFRQWAEQMNADAAQERVKLFRASLKLTNYVHLDHKYSREEMNQR